MSYQVKIEKFEGPLDLLLELIEKEKLEITEVSLSKVTDQFLAFIEQNHDIEASFLADFLVVAAQLLFIKSKALLPSLELEEEASLTVDELEYRLKEYKKFKEIAQEIKRIFHAPRYSFERKFFRPKQELFYPGENLSLDALKNSFENLIQYFEEQEKLEEKSIEKTVSISEKITEIKSFLVKNQKLDFELMTSETKSKVDVVVTFLALLELVKQRSVKLSQERDFGNILIEKIKDE
ncbi:segregation/condensation protein A [Patescibacteria group bacterium]|nr:segregation/condensation protein A [Patescibacteria group bacterium]